MSERNAILGVGAKGDPDNPAVGASHVVGLHPDSSVTDLALADIDPNANAGELLEQADAEAAAAAHDD